ncbi:uncharacterized protein LOC117008241 [Catharus ustulatus]|uniref:uncharacterized protein LOC117008241 n=1 Tax=Catharus ustulatus TaxID=91951 RepID=UPI00140B0498|nr:uncharacterized protein LOC117008241 [Catharus ustulatus]
MVQVLPASAGAHGPGAKPARSRAKQSREEPAGAAELGQRPGQKLSKTKSKRRRFANSKSNKVFASQEHRRSFGSGAKGWDREVEGPERRRPGPALARARDTKKPELSYRGSWLKTEIAQPAPSGRSPLACPAPAPGLGWPAGHFTVTGGGLQVTVPRSESVLQVTVTVPRPGDALQVTVTVPRSESVLQVIVPKFGGGLQVTVTVPGGWPAGHFTVPRPGGGLQVTVTVTGGGLQVTVTVPRSESVLQVIVPKFGGGLQVTVPRFEGGLQVTVTVSRPGVSCR